MASTPVDKGKGRAHDTQLQHEAAPLLPPSSPKPSTHASSSTPQRRNRLRHGRGPLIQDSEDDDASIASESSTRRPRSRSASLLYRRAGAATTTTRVLCTFLGIVLLSLLVALAVLHLWIGHVISEQGNHGDLEEMAQRGVLFAGPSAVRLGGGGGEAAVVVELDGMAGVDVRKALDWESKDEGGWLRRAEGRIARWGARKLGSVSVAFDRAMLFDAHEEIDQARQLVVVQGVETIRLPLSYPSKADPLPQMHPFTLRIPVAFPTPEVLAEVARKAWDDHKYAARVELDDLHVTLGGAKTKGLFGSIVRRMGRVTVGPVAREIYGKGKHRSVAS